MKLKWIRPAVMLAVLTVLFKVTYGYESQDTQNKQKEVGIDEKLGEQVPLDAVFTDEEGKQVTLKTLLGKPTILMLVYYRCPGLCSPLMNSVSGVVDKMDMEAGKDYNLVTISFDPTETWQIAAAKKGNYFDMMKKKIPQSSWRFLTGDSVNIARITNSVGFRYQKQGNDYMHSPTITVLSPEGKIARYLNGTDFLPLDVKLALTEAAEGKTGPTINKLLKLCFSYDPVGGRYVLNITRVAGGIMLLVLAGFVIILTVKKKKHNPHLNGLGKGSI